MTPALANYRAAKANREAVDERLAAARAEIIAPVKADVAADQWLAAAIEDRNAELSAPVAKREAA